jgi:hypothetical protein
MTMTKNPTLAKVLLRTSHGDIQLLLRGTRRRTGADDKFRFSATVEGGTGRYIGATGSGSFTGRMNRRTRHHTLNGSFSLTY